MPVVTVDGFSVKYEVVVAARAGFEERKMVEAYNIGALGFENSNSIMPKGNPMMALTALQFLGGEEDDEDLPFSWFDSAITFSAVGVLDGGEASKTKTLTLGFVQNLTDSVRQVRYKHGHEFEWRHAALPVKDGTGDPWYKSGTGRLASVNGGAKAQFSIQAGDAPTFGYPLTMNGKQDKLAVDTVSFHDKFHCCLAARVEQPARPATLTFLHSVRWQFDVSLPGETIGGIRVTTERSIPPPFESPVGFKTTGAVANVNYTRHFQ